MLKTIFPCSGNPTWLITAMCCILNCITLIFSLFQRVLTIALFCVVGCTILMVMAFAICMGVALGYNYSMASSSTNSNYSTMMMTSARNASKKLHIGETFAKLLDPLIRNPVFSKGEKKKEKLSEEIKLARYGNNKLDSPTKLKIEIKVQTSTTKKQTNQKTVSLKTTSEISPGSYDYEPIDNVNDVELDRSYAKLPIFEVYGRLPPRIRPTDFVYNTYKIPSLRSSELPHTLGDIPIWQTKTETEQLSPKPLESVIAKSPSPDERPLQVLPLKTTCVDEYEDSDLEDSEKFVVNSLFYDDDTESDDDVQNPRRKCKRVKVRTIDQPVAKTTVQTLTVTEEATKDKGLIIKKRNIKDKTSKRIYTILKYIDY